MKTIKHIISLLLSSALLCIASCGTAQNFPAQTDPDTSQFDDVPHSITAYTDMEEYPVSFDKVTVTVKNETAGQGFYFFDIPVIEYNDNGKWTRLNYSPDSYDIPEKWALCFIEGEPELQFSTVMTIWQDSLEGSWRGGEYREVVFAGNQTVYAPFRLK